MPLLASLLARRDEDAELARRSLLPAAPVPAELADERAYRAYAAELFAAMADLS